LIARFAPFLLLAQVLVFFRQALFTTRFAIPYDLPGYHLPLAAFLARRLREGAWPLWDPYSFCGVPFFANIQAQVFYPPAVVCALIANWLGPVKLQNILEWSVATHVWMGGVFAFLLMRRLELGIPACLAGATIFQLGGFYASQAQHLGAVCGAAWLPLAWRQVLVLGEGFTWRRAGLLGVGLAMSVLAGFPAMTGVVFGTTATLAVALWVTRQADRKILAAVAAAIVAGLLLSAVQWIPTAELSRHSRALSRAAWAGENGVPLEGLVSLVAPNWYSLFDWSEYKLQWNPTFLYLYSSLGGLMLAVAGVLCRHRLRWPMLLTLAAGGAWMMGDYTPVYRLLKHAAPDSVRSALYAEFAMAAFLLALAVFAAIGFERFVAGRGLMVSLAVVVMLAADLIVVGSGRPMNTTSTREIPPTHLNQFEGSPQLVAKLRELTGRPCRLGGSISSTIPFPGRMCFRCWGYTVPGAPIR